MMTCSKAGRLNRCWRGLALAWVVLLGLGCGQNQPEVRREIPWALSGSWMVVDFHTHTTFSDGKSTVDELAGFASDHGCNAIGVTDHLNVEKVSKPEYLQAIDQARALHEDLIIFSGVEWNIPPFDGRKHVTVLFDPELEGDLLPGFRSFEQTESAEAGLSWLAERVRGPSGAVLFYNHPSRDNSDTVESVQDFARWRALSQLFVGFEGAPGHQRSEEIGSYRGRIKTEDRWDPVAADIGGGWDALLEMGEDAWAALANSDYHNGRMDYQPCEFARTHVQVPERTAGGILRALQAGSFWAGHGRVIDELLFVVSARNLEIPVSPGEMVKVTSSTGIRVSVTVARHINAAKVPLLVELIGNCVDGKIALIDQKTLEGGEQTAEWAFAGLKQGRDGKSCFLRTRIRRNMDEAPDLMAYSNPIRIQID